MNYVHLLPGSGVIGYIANHDSEDLYVDVRPMQSMICRLADACNGIMRVPPGSSLRYDHPTPLKLVDTLEALAIMQGGSR